MRSHSFLALLTDALDGFSGIAGDGGNVKTVQNELEDLVKSIRMFVNPLRELGDQLQGDASNGEVGVWGDGEKDGDGYWQDR